MKQEVSLSLRTPEHNWRFGELTFMAGASGSPLADARQCKSQKLPGPSTVLSLSLRGFERIKFWIYYMLDGLYRSAEVFFIPYLILTVIPSSSPPSSSSFSENCFSKMLKSYTRLDQQST
jgi:hypothetical protein